MKSINDKFFDSHKINNLRAIIGGGATCQYTRKGDHVLHDGDICDPDPV
ncbi:MULTISPECIES: hypothetical protein [Aquimarina]|nr:MULTISPECIES: hypothetical protein [Aquimarina]